MEKIFPGSRPKVNHLMKKYQTRIRKGIDVERNTKNFELASKIKSNMDSVEFKTPNEYSIEDANKRNRAFIKRDPVYETTGQKVRKKIRDRNLNEDEYWALRYGEKEIHHIELVRLTKAFVEKFGKEAFYRLGKNFTVDNFFSENTLDSIEKNMPVKLTARFIPPTNTILEYLISFDSREELKEFLDKIDAKRWPVVYNSSRTFQLCSAIQAGAVPDLLKTIEEKTREMIEREARYKKQRKKIDKRKEERREFVESIEADQKLLKYFEHLPSGSPRPSGSPTHVPSVPPAFLSTFPDFYKSKPIILSLAVAVIKIKDKKAKKYLNNLLKYHMRTSKQLGMRKLLGSYWREKISIEELRPGLQKLGSSLKEIDDKKAVIEIEKINASETVYANNVQDAMKSCQKAMNFVLYVFLWYIKSTYDTQKRKLEKLNEQQ